MKIKILHIINSKAFGGLELYVTQFIKKLKESDLENYIICQMDSRIERELDKYISKIHYGKSDFYFNISDILQICKIIKKEKIDILHSHTRFDVWKASLSKLFFRDIPHINSVYMLPTNKNDAIHKLIYSKVDAIVTSSIVSNNLIAINYPISPEKINLIRYGRDINAYNKSNEKRNEIRSLWGCNSNDIIVMSMSRIDEQKGLRDFAKSLSFLPLDIKNRIKFWIVGEPTSAGIDKKGNTIYEEESINLYKWLKEYSEKNSNKGIIKLIPFQKDYIAYLNAADIFILPSLNEMYSLSVIDAMLMGLPVIGTKAEGTQEQISDGVNGLLVDISSPEQIANSIKYLVENPTIMESIGLKALEIARNIYNWEKTINDWKKLYKSKINYS